MSNTYRALSQKAEAVFAPGVFVAEFTPSEEKDHLDSGLIEIVPRTYRVLTDNFSGGPMGSKWTAALLRENEAALLGIHIERVEDDQPTGDAADSAPGDSDDSAAGDTRAAGPKSTKK